MLRAPAADALTSTPPTTGNRWASPGGPRLTGPPVAGPGGPSLPPLGRRGPYGPEAAEEDEDADVAEDAGVVEGAKRKRSSEGPPPQGPRRRAGMRSGRAAGSSDLAGRGCSRWQDCLEP